MHPRNRFTGSYNFEVLTKACPDLSSFVFINKYDTQTIDFANAEAVKLLNQALLKQYYSLEYWDIPDGYLCPPIPGRADYVHFMADLLSSKYKEIPTGKQINCLDIGVGANCVYPIIATLEYGWSFVGSDIDKKALTAAEAIIKFNVNLKNQIELRHQPNRKNIFEGVILPNDYFELVFCNPPFHSSIAEANAANIRKVSNLNAGKTPKLNLNFGGQNNELWTEGGEAKFISSMIQESQTFKKNCCWFTSLVSKKESLVSIYKNLEKIKPKHIKTVEMEQGNKKSRFVAWSFE